MLERLAAVTDRIDGERLEDIVSANEAAMRKSNRRPGWSRKRRPSVRYGMIDDEDSLFEDRDIGDIDAGCAKEPNT